MASSRVMATTTSANSDLVRQPPHLSYPLSPVVPVGASASGDLQITARALGPLGSMNMEDLLRNMYPGACDGDVASSAPVGEIAPYCGGAAKTEDEEDEERRTADEVWGGIPGRDGKISNGNNGVGGASLAVDTGPMVMTLEDFMAWKRYGVEVVTDEDGRVAQEIVPTPPPQQIVEGSMLGMVMDSVLGEPYAQAMPKQTQQGVSADGAFTGFNNNGVEGGALARSKRRALLEPEDKVQQQRQRRMIKNRESAARSRERKQAYTIELEKTVTQLEEENMRLRAEQEEARKKRLKELMETLVPITEKRTLASSNGLKRTPAPANELRRTLSM